MRVARLGFTLERMSLRTKRLQGNDDEPLSLEVEGLSPASTLLWHLCRLPGLKVVAKKSWALTDDFEAYFSYKGRLFIVQTPMVAIWVSLIGQPPDEELFSEIEAHVQRFPGSSYFFALVAAIRFFFVPLNPHRQILQAQGVNVSKWWA